MELIERHTLLLWRERQTARVWEKVCIHLMNISGFDSPWSSKTGRRHRMDGQAAHRPQCLAQLCGVHHRLSYQPANNQKRYISCEAAGQSESTSYTPTSIPLYLVAPAFQRSASKVELYTCSQPTSLHACVRTIDTAFPQKIALFVEFWLVLT